MQIAYKLKVRVLVFVLSMAGGIFATEKTFASGKDLSGRFGLGSSEIGSGTASPSFSLDWQMDRSSAAQLNLGLDTGASQDSFLLGARYYRNLFIENPLQFSIFLGAGLVSKQVADASASGYLLEAGTQAKFFLPQLPNLGISLANAFRMESPGGVRIRSVFFASFHYYF